MKVLLTDAQADLGLRCPYMPKDRVLLGAVKITVSRKDFICLVYVCSMFGMGQIIPTVLLTVFAWPFFLK